MSILTCMTRPLAAIGLAVVPLLALAATDNATLTVGRDDLFGFCMPLRFSGYPFTGGAYSPTGLTGGQTITILSDLTCSGAPQTSTLRVTGFAFDPGQLWLTSVTCNGITKSAASASSFSYSAGVATWSWGSTFSFHTKTVGTNVSCSVVHN